MDISGIFPPITTPFDEGEEINLSALKMNVERLMTSRVAAAADALGQP